MAAYIKPVGTWAPKPSAIRTIPILEVPVEQETVRVFRIGKPRHHPWIVEHIGIHKDHRTIGSRHLPLEHRQGDDTPPGIVGIGRVVDFSWKVCRGGFDLDVFGAVSDTGTDMAHPDPRQVIEMPFQ